MSAVQLYETHVKHKVLFTKQSEPRTQQLMQASCPIGHNHVTEYFTFDFEREHVVIERKSKMPHSIRVRVSLRLCFPIGLKNTNLVDDVEFLLPVKLS